MKIYGILYDNVKEATAFLNESEIIIVRNYFYSSFNE